MTRFLKYSTDSLDPLNQNTKHRFAQDHALNIYKSRSIYSFIPKNACSTMRLSIARANGCIKDLKDFNWIHKNNGTFGATLQDLARASYAFIILRDPFSRLVSVYLNKIIDRDTVAWNFIDLHDRSIDIEDVTFEFFIRSLVKPEIRNGNIHWRPQSDFLIYDEYDDYFSVEEFDDACVSLKNKIDLDVIDARPLIKHQTSGYNALCEDEPYRLSPIKLLKFKKDNYLPFPESMFNEELIDLVLTAYSDDVDLYKDKISSNGSSLHQKLLKKVSVIV